MRRAFFAVFVLLSVFLECSAQEIQPLRVSVAYSNGLWLEGEYAIPLSSVTLSPALLIGDLSTTDVGVGVQVRVYPFSAVGAGFYGAVAGIYDYHYAGAAYTNLDAERIGVGYRLILFKVLTGNLEVGWSLQNTVGNDIGIFSNVTQPNSIYEEIGIGVAL
jgi:hypothetical protein